MKRPEEGDDVRPLRVIARELDGGLDRLGARVRKERARAAFDRHDVRHGLAERHLRLVIVIGGSVQKALRLIRRWRGPHRGGNGPWTRWRCPRSNPDKHCRPRPPPRRPRRGPSRTARFVDRTATRSAVALENRPGARPRRRNLDIEELHEPGALSPEPSFAIVSAVPPPGSHHRRSARSRREPPWRGHGPVGLPHRRHRRENRGAQAYGGGQGRFAVRHTAKSIRTATRTRNSSTKSPGYACSCYQIALRIPLRRAPSRWSSAGITALRPARWLHRAAYARASRTCRLACCGLMHTAT